MVLRFWFRKDWGAKYWNKRNKRLVEPLYHPVRYILLYYQSYYKTCRKDLTCKKAMKRIQKSHIQELKFPDIAYNFCIGGDAVVYEARGWVTKPQCMDPKYKDYNGNSIDIAYIGDYRATQVKFDTPITMVTRKEWGAKVPNYPGLQPLKRPAMSVLLRYYTGWDICHTAGECIPIVRDIQRRDQKNDLVDISHNFLIGPDGTIFEGRGWVESESPDFDLKKLGREIGKSRVSQLSTINLAYIGNFQGVNSVTEVMKKAVQDIIHQGVKYNQIAENHKFMSVYEVK